MFVQQRIIRSHKAYKLAHESQKRQNDYPIFVQILTVGEVKYLSDYPFEVMRKSSILLFFIVLLCLYCFRLLLNSGFPPMIRIIL